jgi:predicted branched-subunit amino acid permease
MALAPGVAAWGVVTGVAMVQAGLGVPLAIFLSLVVYAGTAQLVALPLLAAGAPALVVWAAALCVNLRFVLYSAQWRPYLGHHRRAVRMALSYGATDLNFVLFQRTYPEPRPQPGQTGYLLGTSLALWSVWQLASLAGILMADAIPLHWGLGFAGTLAILGLALSLVNDRRSALIAAVSGSAAVAAFALPLKLNLVVALATAIAAALLLDRLRPVAVKDRWT